jgi:hypothetical protein
MDLRPRLSQVRSYPDSRHRRATLARPFRAKTCREQVQQPASFFDYFVGADQYCPTRSR